MRSASAPSRQGEVGSAATTSSIRKTAAGFARSEQREGHQQQRFAENGEGHVDGARALRRGRAVTHDELIGRDADERVDEIEGEEIGGDENPETARHRQQPRDGEAPVRPASRTCENRGADNDPQQRGDREQERARQIEPEAQAQRGRLEPKRAADNREDCGGQRRNRREPLKRQRRIAQAPHEAGRQEQERDGERRREQPGAQRAGHGSAAVAAARPI